MRLNYQGLCGRATKDAWRLRHDMVVVDQSTESVYFMPIKVANIVRLHGVPLSIILDQDRQFTSYFRRSVLKKKMTGTQLKFSTAFHP